MRVRVTGVLLRFCLIYFTGGIGGFLTNSGFLAWTAGGGRGVVTYLTNRESARKRRNLVSVRRLSRQSWLEGHGSVAQPNWMR